MGTRPVGDRRGARSAAAPLPPLWRYRLTRVVLRVAARAYFRFSVEGCALPNGAAIVCFNHLNWSDPLFIMAALPRRVFFVGPEQADMRRGARNRLMSWVGIAIPFEPGRRGLVATARRTGEILERRGLVAIAGEGRIHEGERSLLPLDEGAAFFARRFAVPIVPVAVNGTNWLGFRRRVRIRVGDPIAAARAGGRPQDETMLTDELAQALRTLVADFPEPPPPGPVGMWLTELFNEWPEGTRPRGDGTDPRR